MITVSGFTACYVSYRQNSTLNALMCPHAHQINITWDWFSFTAYGMLYCW